MRCPRVVACSAAFLVASIAAGASLLGAQPAAAWEFQGGGPAPSNHGRRETPPGSCRHRCDADEQVGPAEVASSTSYRCFCDEYCVIADDCCVDACEYCGVDCRWPTPRPTPMPTKRPTPRPKPTPTKRPTPMPTKRPTPRPTPMPTKRPTPRPTPTPTKRPTPMPTKRPTPRPKPVPTRRPTPRPTKSPGPLDDCKRDKRPVDLTLSAVLALSNAEVPRGSSPLPTYAWPRQCPAPAGYEEGVQIGPAAIREESTEQVLGGELVTSLGPDRSRDAMGTSVSWGSVPFRWEGVRYDTQSSLCVTSRIVDTLWRTKLSCKRPTKCSKAIDVPVGSISASNYIVMPPYVTDAAIEVALQVNEEYTEVLSWPLSILETPNDPRKNPGRRCPGPADAEGRCDDLLSIDSDSGAGQRHVTLNNGIRYAANLRFGAGDHVTRNGTSLWTREQSVNLADLILQLQPLC